MDDRDNGRLLSLDAYRGMVMLLLIPDVYGGFSFYEMARRFPDDRVWGFLARAFTHVPWSGCSIWDLLLPSFLFVVGVAMPYSYAARKREGQSDGKILGHAVLRALALLMLGVVVQIPIRTGGDMLWPLLLLAFGLPMSRFLTTIAGGRVASNRYAIEVLWWSAILLLSAIHLFQNFHRIGYLQLHDVLLLIGFGYVFAFLLLNRGRAVQGGVAVVILFAYGLAFVLYPPAAPDLDLARVGVMPGDEVFDGFFAHWNKGTNVAAAFDTWFLNLFPRAEPFVYNAHGYQTLNAVPSLATMIFGLMVGEYLRGDKPRIQLRNGLFKAGIVFIGTALLMGWLLCPIVKSISTPSWILFSTGCVLIFFAGFYHALDVRRHRAWAIPLVIAGASPILIYTFALEYRWWIVEAWRRTLGPSLFDISWAPVLESLICALSLWLLALLLYRLKLPVRF